MYDKNVWPDVPRTSGLPVEIKRNVTLFKERRKSTNAPRYRKIKKESTTIKKLKRTLAQRDSWNKEIRDERAKKKKKIPIAVKLEPIAVKLEIE